jgi:imidazolonepropionase-like amidohydrolase
VGRQILHVDESGLDRARRAEAHRLGLHVHGHVPATMRPSEAVRAGYDELTHLNFVVMQAMPKEVVDKANTGQRIEGPARFFKDVDWTRPMNRGFIAELAQRGRSSIRPSSSSTDADAWTAASRTRPMRPIWASSRRCSTAASSRGGYPLVEGLHARRLPQELRQDGRARRPLHKAGVPIVAGTDGWGIELVRELELYQQAGFTPARRCRARPSSRRASSAPTSAPARSRSARKPTWCWSTAILRRSSARCAAS